MILLDGQAAIHWTNQTQEDIFRWTLNGKYMVLDFSLTYNMFTTMLVCQLCELRNP